MAIFIVFSRILIYSVFMLNEYDCHNTYIRHAIDEKPRLVNDDMHIHSRCEIYFFISGKVDYLVEGSRYPLMPDSHTSVGKVMAPLPALFTLYPLPLLALKSMESLLVPFRR